MELVLRVPTSRIHRRLHEEDYMEDSAIRDTAIMRAEAMVLMAMRAEAMVFMAMKIPI